MKRTLSALLLCVFYLSAVASKVPDTAWQMGTLRDMKTDTVSGVSGVANHGVGILATHYFVVTHYLIDGPGMSYEANWLIRSRRDKQLLVTLRGPIKFALIGHDFYIQDEEGKTRKLVFVAKAVRE